MSHYPLPQCVYRIHQINLDYTYECHTDINHRPTPLRSLSSAERRVNNTERAPGRSLTHPFHPVLRNLILDT
jgi:hypothetical protein